MVGSEAFRQELLAHMSQRRGVEHYGAELGKAAQQNAEQVVPEELRKWGWSEEELSQRRKGHPTESMA